MHIIVIFPKAEAGKKVRDILIRAGYHDVKTCTTIAAARSFAQTFEEGLIIAYYRLPDESAIQLYEDLYAGFQMIITGPADVLEDYARDDVLMLAMPFHKSELLSTVETLLGNRAYRTKRQLSGKSARPVSEQKIIESAKALLIERNRLTEEQAHRFLQKASMNRGLTLIQAAQIVLNTLDETS